MILDNDRAVRLILARVREELRRWPIGWDRKERILTGVAVAVRDQLRGPVRRGDAVVLARGVVCELRRGERIGGSLPIACRFARYAVRAAAQGMATARKAPAIPSPGGGGEELPTPKGGPAELEWVRVRPARKLRPPIRDPADLDGRKAAMIAELESDVVWETADLRKDSKLLPTSLAGKPGQREGRDKLYEEVRHVGENR